MVSRGFEIGSHSSVHAILAREKPAEQYEDLVASKRILEDKLDTPVDLLVYPNENEATSPAPRSTRRPVRDTPRPVTTIHGRNSRATPPHELRVSLCNRKSAYRAS